MCVWRTCTHVSNKRKIWRRPTLRTISKWSSLCPVPFEKWSSWCVNTRGKTFLQFDFLMCPFKIHKVLLQTNNVSLYLVWRFVWRPLHEGPFGGRYIRSGTHRAHVESLKLNLFFSRRVRVLMLGVFSVEEISYVVWQVIYSHILCVLNRMRCASLISSPPI